MENNEFIYRNHVPLHDTEFTILSKYIYDNYGINFSAAKKQLLESRLQKRLSQLGLKKFKDYIDHVLHDEENEEIIKMINSVTTNKTDFFREQRHFTFLLEKGLSILTPKQASKLKIWSAACSSGEEVYTIAMTMEDYLEKHHGRFDYHILGTDISTEVLNKAYQAIYHQDLADDIPEEAKKKYLLKSIDPSKKTIRIAKKLRDKVAFDRFNLVGTAYPKSETYDIIFCRNAIIYFDRATQRKILTNLCRCLKSGGYLFLGHSESIIGMELPLTQIIHTCYQKK